MHWDARASRLMMKAGAARVAADQPMAALPSSVLVAAALAALLFFLLDYAVDVGLWARPRRALAGRLVVITGAAGGLGRALALEFARCGAVLALWDVRADALRDSVAWLVHECAVPAAAVHSARAATAATACPLYRTLS